MIRWSEVAKNIVAQIPASVFMLITSFMGPGELDPAPATPYLHPVVKEVNTLPPLISNRYVGVPVPNRIFPDALDTIVTKFTF